jgi:hypothetical protein
LSLPNDKYKEKISAIMKVLGLIALLLAPASVDAFLSTNSPKVAFRSTHGSNLCASRDSEDASLSQNLKHLAVMTAVTFSLLAVANCVSPHAVFNPRRLIVSTARRINQGLQTPPYRQKRRESLRSQQQ